MKVLSNASHLDLEIEERKFFNLFSDNVSPLLPSHMLSIKTSFRETIVHSKSAKEMASFLFVKNASLATTYLDVSMTVLEIVATAERYFSKLKLIKNFLRSF